MNTGDAALFAGAARCDITPPLSVGLLMSSVERQWAPFEGVRAPLSVRVLTLTQGETRVVLLSFDVLGFAARAVGGWARFMRRICAAAGDIIRPDQLIVTCTHTHTSPETAALTPLYRTADFKRWLTRVIDAAGQAIVDADRRAQPCRVRIGATRLPGHAIQRRIHTTQGVVLSHPPPPPEIVLSRDGPMDDSVSTLLFEARDSAEPLAVLVNATCHPVHEMCIPRISPDYPGDLCARIEAGWPGATALFLNGAAGDINPPTVSGGAGDAVAHGTQLADAAMSALLAASPVGVDGLSLRRGIVRLPMRTIVGRVSAQRLSAEVAALRLGDVDLVFLPGEPFVGIGQEIRSRSPAAHTFIAGYAHDWIGYIPIDSAFEEGGYEIGPGAWSRAGQGSAHLLIDQACDLLFGRHRSGSSSEKP